MQKKKKSLQCEETYVKSVDLSARIAGIQSNSNMTSTVNELNSLFKSNTLAEVLENDLGFVAGAGSSEQEHEDFCEKTPSSNDSLEDEHSAVAPNSDAENSSAAQSAEEDVELPSNVTDRRQIFLPLDLKTDDPRIYGKWMWFTNGNLALQDYMWIHLSRLILSGEVILLESSTAKVCNYPGKNQGVIKCYTRGDKTSIKKAGVAIQKIITDDTILFYKTNQASKESLSRDYGDRFITEYMLTLNGKFYEKDKLDRWVPVNDSLEAKSASNPILDKYLPVHKSCPVLDQSSGTDYLPSQEFEKIRYFYPEHSTLTEHDELWSLFCDVTDFDSNGMTELDRAWIETRKLYDKGFLLSTSCETYAAECFAPDLKRRSLSCVVGKKCTYDQVIESGDRLRDSISYNLPMYMKACYLGSYGSKRSKLKYLYTEDGNLYEYVDDVWTLVRKAI